MVTVSRNPDYQKQVKELQRISHEIEEIHKMKDPNNIKLQFDNVKSKLFDIEKRFSRLEQTQGEIIKKQAKILQQLLSNGFDGMKKDLKDHIKNELTDIDLKMMKLEFEFYKPDLTHLHKRNLEKSLDVSEE